MHINREGGAHLERPQGWGQGTYLQKTVWATGRNPYEIKVMRAGAAGARPGQPVREGARVDQLTEARHSPRNKLLLFKKNYLQNCRSSLGRKGD